MSQFIVKVGREEKIAGTVRKEFKALSQITIEAEEPEKALEVSREMSSKERKLSNWDPYCGKHFRVFEITEKGDEKQILKLTI